MSRTDVSNLRRRLLLFISLFIPAFIGCEEEAVDGAGEPASASDNLPGWVAQDSGSSHDLGVVDAIAPDLAWTASATTLLRSEDGTTWSDRGSVPSGQSSVLPGLSSPVLDVHFIDAQSGFALTRNGLLSTSNGGQTWTSRPSSIAAPKRAMSFVSPSTGWVAHEGGWGISRTTDGGATWDYIPRNTSVWWEAYALKFVDAQTGWLAARAGWAPGHALFKSTDGGERWSKVWADPEAKIAAIDSVHAEHAWFIDRDRIYSTADGGSTWTFQQIDGSGDLKALCFVDAATGWCVGRRIHKTADGGVTWTLQPTEREGFRDIDFADAATGWAVGENGIIFKTTTAGD